MHLRFYHLYQFWPNKSHYLVKFHYYRYLVIRNLCQVLMIWASIYYAVLVQFSSFVI